MKRLDSAESSVKPSINFDIESETENTPFSLSLKVPEEFDKSEEVSYLINDNEGSPRVNYSPRGSMTSITSISQKIKQQISDSLTSQKFSNSSSPYSSLSPSTLHSPRPKDRNLNDDYSSPRLDTFYDDGSIIISEEPKSRQLSQKEWAEDEIKEEFPQKCCCGCNSCKHCRKYFIIDFCHRRPWITILAATLFALAICVFFIVTCGPCILPPHYSGISTFLSMSFFILYHYLFPSPNL
jgi:hypothetical protein